MRGAGCDRVTAVEAGGVIRRSRGVVAAVVHVFGHHFPDRGTVRRRERGRPLTTLATTKALTTILPLCALWSKPQ